MFCSSCGNQVQDGVAYCPSCGAPVKNSGTQSNVSSPVTNSQNTNFKREVFVRGFKCAGGGMYYAFSYYVPLIIFFLGCFLCNYTDFGLFLVLVGIVFALFVKKIFKQSILYDDNQKVFIYNAHSHLSFTMRTVKLSDVKNIRLRYVKIDWSGAYTLNDPGKYHVICFDTADSKQALKVWFPKNGNMEEFIPALEQAVRDSGNAIAIDRNDTLMKNWKDFE